jgi:alpha-1,2-mannosyltransferase
LPGSDAKVPASILKHQVVLEVAAISLAESQDRPGPSSRPAGPDVTENRRVSSDRSRRRVSPLELGVFAQLPLVIAGVLVWAVVHGPGFDFAIFRTAGLAVLHGHSPYVRPSLSLLRQQNHFVYPQPIAYLFAPFALMPPAIGGIVFLLISLAALVAGLRLLGVTDWRLWGFPLLTAPSFDAAGLGTVNFLLLLLIAVGWRSGGSSWSGAALALAAATKVFLWPLLIWLVVTRRWRACGASAATLAGMLIIWVIADPTGLRNYPRTLRLLEQGHPSTYSLRSLWLAVGLPGVPAIAAVAGLVGCALLIRLRGREREALAVALLTALVSTPILWMHYLVLLVIPLALLWPTLSWAWLVLLPLWVTPSSGPAGVIWQMGMATAAILGVAAIAWADVVKVQRSIPADVVPAPAPR